MADSGTADWAYFDRPATAVEDNLSLMNGRADDAIDSVNDAIEALATLSMPLMPAAPTVTLPDIEIPKVKDNPLPPNISQFGSVLPFIDPSFDDLWATLGFSLGDVDIDIEPFESTIGALTIPDAPDPLDTSGLPTEPTLTDPTLPTAPDPVLPSLDDLTEIVIPEFVFPTLPVFDEDAPEFSAELPITTLAFVEPTYASEVLDDIKAKVRSIFAGGSGIPAAVQLALFERARAREELTANAAIQEAFDTFAGRNFSMPPGMLVAQVNAAQEKAQMAANSLSREVFIKASDTEIANLRMAVEQGMAYETLLHNYTNNVAQRSFEAAKAHLDADIALYNAQAQVFNVRTQAYQTLAQVFKIRIDAALSTLQIYKMQLDGEIAKGQLNEQKVRTFEARLRSVLSVIEIYKAKMEGARVQSEVSKNQIDRYRVSVQAYGEKLQAEKTIFDAYESRIKGETAKAQALESEARAYAATVQAQEARSNVKLRYIDARVAAIRASVEKYSARATSERAAVEASLEAIRAKAAAFAADVGRYTAEIQGNTETVKVGLEVSEARLRNNLAYFDTLVREYDANMDRLLKQVQIQEEALKAISQVGGTLAAGAMAAIHVQASMSGSGSLSSTNTYAVNHNFQDS